MSLMLVPLNPLLKNRILLRHLTETFFFLVPFHDPTKANFSRSILASLFITIFRFFFFRAMPKIVISLQNFINMFRVFALTYHSTGFLSHLPYYFNIKRERVHCTRCMCGASTFTVKFLQINRYVR